MMSVFEYVMLFNGIFPTSLVTRNKLGAIRFKGAYPLVSDNFILHIHMESGYLLCHAFTI